MKQLKRILVCIVCALCVCGVMTQPTEAAAKKQIVLNAKTAQIQVGTKTNIKIKKVKGLKSKKVTYKSSNKKVATVSNTGVVSGLKEGTATITVTSKENKKIRAKFKVKVVKRNDFFTNSGATIQKVGTTYIQDGYISAFVYEKDPTRSMYSARTTVTYTNVKKWNKKYDVIDFKISVSVPEIDNYYSRYYRYGIYDTSGKEGSIAKAYTKFSDKSEIQFLIKESYVFTTYCRVLVPKNEGVYFMYGGFDSPEHFGEVTSQQAAGAGNDGEERKQLTESDISKNESYFYISSAEAEKALKKK